MAKLLCHATLRYQTTARARGGRLVWMQDALPNEETRRRALGPRWGLVALSIHRRSPPEPPPAHFGRIRGPRGMIRG